MKIRLKCREQIELSVTTVGSGKPLLCLCGFAASGKQHFESLIPYLSRRYRMIILDYRGMGDSSKSSKAYRLEDLAIDAVSIMDELKITHFSILAISMGGFIAQIIALMKPERVERLVLLCSTSNGPEFIGPPLLTEEMICRGFARSGNVYERSLKIVSGLVHRSFIEQKPEEFEQIIQNRIKLMADVDQVLLQQKAVALFLSETLPIKRISCPTLVLMGQNDRFVPTQDAKAFEKIITGSIVKFIPNSDHLFFLEKPAQVSRHIKTFFDTEDSSGYRHQKSSSLATARL